MRKIKAFENSLECKIIRERKPSKAMEVYFLAVSRHLETEFNVQSDLALALVSHLAIHRP